MAGVTSRREDGRPRLQRHIGETLGRIKRPRDIHVVEALPMTPTGKLLRRKLRELVR